MSFATNPDRHNNDQILSKLLESRNYDAVQIGRGVTLYTLIDNIPLSNEETAMIEEISYEKFYISVEIEDYDESLTSRIIYNIQQSLIPVLKRHTKLDIDEITVEKVEDNRINIEGDSGDIDAIRKRSVFRFYPKSRTYEVYLDPGIAKILRKHYNMNDFTTCHFVEDSLSFWVARVLYQSAKDTYDYKDMYDVVMASDKLSKDSIVNTIHDFVRKGYVAFDVNEGYTPMRYYIMAEIVRMWEGEVISTYPAVYKITSLTKSEIESMADDILVWNKIPRRTLNLKNYSIDDVNNVYNELIGFYPYLSIYKDKISMYRNGITVVYLASKEMEDMLIGRLNNTWSYTKNKMKDIKTEELLTIKTTQTQHKNEYEVTYTISNPLVVPRILSPDELIHKKYLRKDFGTETHILGTYTNDQVLDLHIGDNRLQRSIDKGEYWSAWGLAVLELGVVSRYPLNPSLLNRLRT